jgi:formylglycine-generating enzyme required for sulfatase activity
LARINCCGCCEGAVTGVRHSGFIVAIFLASILAAAAVSAEDAEAMKPGRVFRDCPKCPEMTVVPAGSFMMGLPESNDRSRHKVTIARPFAVGKFEITRGEFAEFVRDNGRAAGDKCSTFESGKWEERAARSFDNPGFSQNDRHPAVCVSWEDATAFAAWLSGKTGKHYRLLSEAEWEYAARAGAATRHHFGSDNKGLCTHGNLADNADCADGYTYTAPVGSFAPNGFGLYDMHGNVWEWVQDCRNETYRRAPTDGVPRATGDCGLRVLRGGSWDYFPDDLVEADYGKGQPTDRTGDIGFRVARTL